MKAQFEKISAPIHSSFKAFVYEGARFSAPWHFHPEFELAYIEKGEGIRYVANSVQKFNAGDLVLLGSNLPHCWKNSLDVTSGVKSLVFQWDEHVLGENWINKSEFAPIKTLLAQSTRGLKFSDEIGLKYADVLKDIIKKPAFEKLIGFIQLLNKLALIDDCELLSSEHFSSSLNIKANARIDKIYNHIHSNFNKKIMLHEVASLVSMGDEAFCRFFKKTLNKSLFTFINEYRINVATKQLIETNKQVSQIAYECGFESLPYFYKQFQKFMSCSPLQFRKKYLNQISN
ncbi:AraC family transcriptional regulator [Tamlana agarivorans]|uniref:AraC family transcriptional regulator n=1 Tax=Pseudotamlana agarivorans TaxID=481183 RepID=A0ACC5U998_9FLAO|nr:AraC family transcriptional regulator [Tamlana agarivorans]MBU2950851.1 AraC family transcriptional regulator [Tamlana agarivorans]